MRNHTLMQTIAQANRVFRDKLNNLIVDYVGIFGIFRDLEKALAIYGSEYGGGVGQGETLVLRKSKLAEPRPDAIKATDELCKEHGIDLQKIQDASGFDKVRVLDEARDALVANEDSKRRYLALAADVLRLFRAILPDPSANEFIAVGPAIAVLVEKICCLAPDPDISGVTAAVEDLLNRPVAAEAHVIRESVEVWTRSALLI